MPSAKPGKLGMKHTAPAAGSLRLQQTVENPANATPQSLLALQRRFGNRAVQRVLVAGGQLTAGTEAAIHDARGGGTHLPHLVRGPMERAFGTNFGRVRVQTNSKADTLNRQISAKAFTVGSDIFFRRGTFDPASSSGRELLAHELTHTVQQGQGAGQPQAKLAIGPADDAYEREADCVARQVVGALDVGTSPAADAETGAERDNAIGQTAQRSGAPDEVVQRKVGFEFEADAWHSWTLTDDLSAPEKAQPAGRAMSDVEFVTDPLETIGEVKDTAVKTPPSSSSATSRT
jgi:hypothetical protein